MPPCPGSLLVNHHPYATSRSALSRRRRRRRTQACMPPAPSAHRAAGGSERSPSSPKKCELHKCCVAHTRRLSMHDQPLAAHLSSVRAQPEHTLKVLSNDEGQSKFGYRGRDENFASTVCTMQLKLPLKGQIPRAAVMSMRTPGIPPATHAPALIRHLCGYLPGPRELRLCLEF